MPASFTASEPCGVPSRFLATKVLDLGLAVVAHLARWPFEGPVIPTLIDLGPQRDPLARPGAGHRRQLVGIRLYVVLAVLARRYRRVDQPEV